MLKAASSAAVIAIAFSSGWVVHGWKYDAAQLALQKSVAAKAEENDALKTKLGVQYDADQKRIDALADDLRGIRVRLPKGCIQPNTPARGSDATARNGTLPANPQDAFDTFAGELGRMTKEADDTVASCRVVLEWAKAQGVR